MPSQPLIRKVRVCDSCWAVTTPTPDTLDTLDGQVSALAPHLYNAARDVLHEAHSLFDFETILGGAFTQLERGHLEHGRSLFDMTDSRLVYELRRELEDAIVYRAEQLRRERHEHDQ